MDPTLRTPGLQKYHFERFEVWINNKHWCSNMSQTLHASFLRLSGTWTQLPDPVVTQTHWILSNNPENNGHDSFINNITKVFCSPEHYLDILCYWNVIIRTSWLLCRRAVRTDGADDAAISVLSVIQTGQVTDGLSCKFMLWEHNGKHHHIRQSTVY